MKKRWLLALVTFVCLAVVVTAFAQEGMRRGGGMRGGDGGPGGPRQGMGMMDRGPMQIAAGGVLSRGAIAIGEGGVVYVLAGNKVIKYNRDLALLKEVEIKMDLAKMQKMPGPQ